MLQHPWFHAKLNPVVLVIQKSSALAGQKTVDITVNGVKVETGQYLAIPGTYKVKSAGYKLVAETNEKVSTSGQTVTITVGEKLALPSGASANIDSTLANAANACMKLDKMALRSASVIAMSLMPQPSPRAKPKQMLLSLMNQLLQAPLLSVTQPSELTPCCRLFRQSRQTSVRAK